MRGVSVIVIALNEAGRLERLKRSLDRLRVPSDVRLETILLDGGSSDGTAGVARQLGFDQVLEMPGATIPACRNRGVREAAGEVLAFVDADCEVAPDWLEKARPWLEREAPTLIGWPVEPPPKPTWVQRAWHLHWLHKNVHALARGQDGTVREQAFRLVTTRNMLLHRRIFDELGGFDEALTTGEDTDFAFRAYLRGFEVIGVPSLRVIHHGEPATLRDFFWQQLWHANRDSYRRILGASGGRVGGHAPLYAAAFLGAVLLAALGAGLAVWGIAPGVGLVLPLVVLIAGPAAVVAARAREPSAFLSLSALYVAYGAARALDLLGLFRAKRSWKARL